MATEAPDNAPNAPADDPKAALTARKWIAELTAAEKAQREWLERAKKLTKRFRAEFEMAVSSRRFPMLWTNIETIKPAVYARAPQPVVTRRFDQPDPVARIASEVLERALSTSIELQDLDAVLKLCRDDYILIGRGVPWERYVPTHGPQTIPDPVPLQIVGTSDNHEDGDDGDEAYAQGEAKPGYEDDEGNYYGPEDDQVQFDKQGRPFIQPEPYEPVVYEESVTDYVNWEDFLHGPGRTWDEVPWVARRIYLTREQMVDRFGKIGQLAPLDWGPRQQGRQDVDQQMMRKAAVYEIWCKTSKRAYWVSKSWSSQPLDMREDPLNLSGFFPCPRPLLSTTGNNCANPVPDAVYYQDQCTEIDKLTARMIELQDALKVRGFYAGDGKTNLTNLMNARNNTLIPVPEWLSLKEQGGAKGMVEWWPIEQVVGALNAIIEQRQQLINDVYQITGIGDVLRGMNDPASTATAERLKGQWGTLRMRDKQKEMARFARDILRIKAEVIAERFGADTLKMISGVQIPTAEEKAQAQAMYDQGKAQYEAQVAQLQQQAAMAAQQAQMAGQEPPQAPQIPPPPPVPEEMQAILDSPTWEDVVALLRDNASRQFRIDVETDSTIEPDEAEEKAQATEFVTAIGGLLAQAGPAVAAQPAVAPLLGEIIKWSARKFRVGRELEPIIDRTMDQIAQQPPQAAQGQAAEAPPDKTAAEVQQGKIAQETIKQQGENQRAEIQANIDMRDQALRAEEMRTKLALVPRDPNPQVAL